MNLYEVRGQALKNRGGFELLSASVVPPGSEGIQHLGGRLCVCIPEWSGDKLSLVRLNSGARQTLQLPEVIKFLNVMLQSNK